MSKKEYKKTEPVSEVDNKKITKEGLFKALFIFKYILPYKTYFGIGLIFLILSSLTTMIFPFATGKLVDASLKKNNLFFQEINNITLA